MALRERKSSGFTLVEMVAVIVLLGILSVGSVSFLRSGVEIYRDTHRRNTLAQQGRFAVERISREVRNALPGSVRAGSDGGTQCLEFMPVEAASSYLGAVADSDQPTFEAVDFTFTDSAVTGYRVAVFTLDETAVYAASSNALASLDQVSTVSDDQRTVMLDAPHLYANESPQQRFYIVKDRISFCASDGVLRRYVGYADSDDVQDIPPSVAVSGSSALLAENIRLADSSGAAVTVFSFSAGTLHRSGVVHLDLRFEENNEWIPYSQAVFLRNTP